MIDARYCDKPSVQEVLESLFGSNAAGQTARWHVDVSMLFILSFPRRDSRAPCISGTRLSDFLKTQRPYYLNLQIPRQLSEVREDDQSARALDSNTY